MADFPPSSLPCLLWWVPLLPLLAAAVIAFLPDSRSKWAARLAIGALAGSCVIALMGLWATIQSPSARAVDSLSWFQFGGVEMSVGLVLDPLSAGMAAMVTFVAFWIFLYSTGYMAEEKRHGRFFGFLSLFCGAMLLVVLSNSLLLMFVAWELVGLASYLLIGFYFDKPAAAAAAQKAFITTRVGDMAFFVGMIWLYAESGTLLFYDGGAGLLESGSLASLAGITTIGGLSVAAVASLLLLVGAMGKSGQVPLHTWLPDAMEGPTPVSALIHAATMVAAGVFLVARTHPLFAMGGEAGIALTATAWVGGITALYAACVALAQSDFKRILAYSTVSQLGFMMVALGTGGVGAAMLHLIAHAFFKALLFLSAGSVIHGCHGEQDIRRMGGLAEPMRATFVAYAVGMMALAGFPFLFSGFWSKEAIFHSAQAWPGGPGPFLLVVAAALLTAFYMTRQAMLVFLTPAREPGVRHPHESPKVMLVPLYVLAAGAVLLSLVATPMWPAFKSWMAGKQAHWHAAGLIEHGGLWLVLLSLVLVSLGVGTGWVAYRRVTSTLTEDPLKARLGRAWGFLERAMDVDAVYQRCIIEPLSFVAGGIDMLERMIMVPLMMVGEALTKAVGRLARISDEELLNRGFDGVCGQLIRRARHISGSLSGRPQGYLRPIGLGMSALLIVYLWLQST